MTALSLEEIAKWNKTFQKEQSRRTDNKVGIKFDFSANRGECVWRVETTTEKSE
jgi:hypothetical protein